MKSLKDFKKIRDKLIIPLGIKGSEIGIENNKEIGKVTVGVGIRLPSYLPAFPYKNFDLWLIDGEINLLLTKEGQFTVKVRTKSSVTGNTNPKYLDEVISAFKKAIIEYGKK